jgi:hypothetical protein
MRVCDADIASAGRHRHRLAIISTNEAIQCGHVTNAEAGKRQKGVMDMRSVRWIRRLLPQRPKLPSKNKLKNDNRAQQNAPAHHQIIYLVITIVPVYNILAH